MDDEQSLVNVVEVGKDDLVGCWEQMKGRTYTLFRGLDAHLFLDVGCLAGDGKTPVWVFFHESYMYLADGPIELLLHVIRDWKDDRILVG